MRTFISITIPENVVNTINNIQNQLPKDNCKLNIAKNHHLTLKFLGEVDENKIELIKKELESIKFSKFKLELDKIGYFPTKDYIRVVWVGFKDNKDVNELQELVNKATNKYKQKQKFHPHITLARVKFIKGKVRFRNEINSIQIPNTKFEITEFKLIKSTLKPEGPIYEDLVKYSL